MFFDLDLPYNINVFEIVSYNYFFSVFQKSEKIITANPRVGGGGKIYLYPKMDNLDPQLHQILKPISKFFCTFLTI